MKKLSLLLCFAVGMGRCVAEEAVAKEVHPAISSESAPHYYYKPQRVHTYSDCSESPYTYYNPDSRRRVITRRRENRVPVQRTRRRTVRTVDPALTAESAPHYYYKEPVQRVRAPEPCTYESHYVKEVNGGSIRYVMNGRVKVCEPGIKVNDRREIGNYNWGWSNSSPDYYKKPLFIGESVVNDVEPVAVRERYSRDRFHGKRVRDDYYY